MPEFYIANTESFYRSSDLPEVWLRDTEAKTKRKITSRSTLHPQHQWTGLHMTVEEQNLARGSTKFYNDKKAI